MILKDFIICLLICFTLSFLIGVERQYSRRTSGLRTTILVSIGAFMFVSYSFLVGANDVSRIASEVVTGIGFLGAGVILKDGKKVHGLTTAATLWCTAAIGVLCAGGAIQEAIICSIVILFANIILRYVNMAINSLSNNNTEYVEYNLVIETKKDDCQNIQYEVKKVLKSDYNLELSNESRKTILNYNFKILKKQFNTIERLINNLNLKYDVINVKLDKINEFNVVDEDYL